MLGMYFDVLISWSEYDESVSRYSNLWRSKFILKFKSQRKKKDKVQMIIIITVFIYVLMFEIMIPFFSLNFYMVFH